MEEPALTLPRAAASLERIDSCFARLHQGPGEVFKVRLPLRLRIDGELIDLSGVDRRREACLEEEAVHRRLESGVSLGVVALTLDAEGQARFGGEGSPIDWALHMRRLPAADRLDRRLEEERLGEQDLDAVARHLARIHGRARRIDPQADPLEALRALARARIEVMDGPRGSPLPAEAGRAEAWQLEWITAHADRLRERSRHSTLREGHGELGLEHVFVDDEGRVSLLAGLEGMPLPRLVDVTADVAFLATGLAGRHRVDLAERFVAAYAEAAQDFDLYPLLDFHTSLGASRRAKVAWLCADRAASGDGRDAGSMRRRAHTLFALALAAPRRPLLPAAVVAMGGQVASGKSTLARHIGERIGAPVVGSDATRDHLLDTGLEAGAHEARWALAYAPGFGDRVYEEVLRRAGEVLRSGRPVVIDGCFRSRSQRQRARRLAERFGRPFLFVEASVSRSVQRGRLLERAERDGVDVDAWQEIADILRSDWETTEGLSDEEHLLLDTAVPLERNAAAIEARLPTWPPDLTG
ncbi:MAG: AAA family ATPase [bacterium]